MPREDDFHLFSGKFGAECDLARYLSTVAHITEKQRGVKVLQDTLRAAFKVMDKNNDGTLTLNETVAALSPGISESIVKEVFAALDPQNDGATLDEFLTFCLARGKVKTAKEMREAKKPAPKRPLPA